MIFKAAKVFLSVHMMCSVLLLACSPLSAKKPAPRILVVPEQSKGTGFGLSGESPSGLFRGGLLIWSPDVKAQQIDNLLRTTRETNEKYVALNRYFTSFQEKEIAPLKRTLEERRLAYAQAKFESDERVSVTQNQKASVWFAQEMDTIKQRFPEFDSTRGESIFHAYCESKILDLATRPFLVKNTFKTRPTPSALCESYYHGRFFTGDVCNPEPTGRNFYECIWNEGVLKTRFADRIQIRFAATATGTKTSTALSLSAFANHPFVKGAFALDDVQFCTASLMRTKFLAGVKFRILASGSLVGGFACGENNRFEISYGVGDWDKDLSNTTAAFLIDSVEAKLGSAQVPEAFQWISPVQSSAPDLLTAVQGMVSKIALFHAGASGCSSEFNSPNDVFFNDARLTQGVSLQGQCKSLLPPTGSLPDVVVIDEQLEQRRLEVGALERELNSLKGNACPLSPSCESAPSGHARCDFLNAQVRKAAAAEARGVASVLITDFALSFDRVTPSATNVVVWMNNAPVGVGCLGEARLGSCSGTTPNQSLSSALPVQADISSNEELVLKMKVDVRQLSAAGVPESVLRQLSLFNENILELNASSNSFEGVVPYLSGKAFVRTDANATQALAEGSVSYLIENTFDRKLGEFCSVQ